MDEGSSLNVRQAPSLTAPIIGSLPAFSFVMVVGGTLEENEFVEVMYTTEGYYGYASVNHIQFHGSSYYLVANVDSGNLNMREGAGTSYSVKARIPKQASFAYDAEMDNGWYRGIYGNARGFTSPEYTKRVGF